MARCNCSSRTCACVIEAGDGVGVVGAGTPANPYVISAEGGGGGVSGWSSGDLKLTAATTTPAGWLECSGQAVSRTAYADLFAAVGTMWGNGNGSTTFNLPNFAGRFPMGAGPDHDLASSGGTEEVALVVANLPPHTHSINHNHAAFTTGSSGAHRHKLDLSNDVGNNNNTIRRGDNHTIDSDNPVESTGAHTHRIDVPAYVGDSGPGSGAGVAFTILPPYRVVRYLIKT